MPVKNNSALGYAQAARPPEWNPKEGGHPQPGHFAGHPQPLIPERFGDRPLSPGIVTATAVAYPADDPWAGYGGAAETSRLQVRARVTIGRQPEASRRVSAERR